MVIKLPMFWNRFEYVAENSGNAFEFLKGHKNECGDFQFTTKAGTIGEIIFNFFPTLLFEHIIDGPPSKDSIIPLF